MNQSAAAPPTADADVVGRVHHVTQQFRSITALDDVSLDLTSGVTGLLGPNGAGKSTLMTMLATVRVPDRGSVIVFGHDTATASGRVAIRRRLGYMPQEPGFHRRFTAFQYVDYLAILKEYTDRGDRHDEVMRVLTAVGLDDRATSRIKDLSGGMRRRLALAQALLGSPDLLVLDEPTVGLDPERRLRFRDLVSRHAQGRTVVVSTHQTEDVAALCQRVVVLHQGAVLFEGTPAALLAEAAGQVWLAPRRHDALLTWRTGDGAHRHIGGEPSSDATPVQASLEDAYLLLLGDLDALEGAA